jgi:hypothetical protein
MQDIFIFKKTDSDDLERFGAVVGVEVKAKIQTLNGFSAHAGKGPARMVQGYVIEFMMAMVAPVKATLSVFGPAGNASDSIDLAISRVQLTIKGQILARFPAVMSFSQFNESENSRRSAVFE